MKCFWTGGRAIVWRMWRCQRNVRVTKIDEVTGHFAEIRVIIMLKTRFKV